MKKCFSFHPNSSQIFVGVVIGIALASVIIVFASYKLGQRQIQPVPQSIPTPSVTPTPGSTADWEAYVNITGGYQIKYPQGWFVREDTDYTSISNYDISKAPGREYHPELDKGKFKVEIYITEKDTTTPLDTWVEDQYRMPTTEVKSKTPVIINGIDGIKVESEGMFGSSAVVYLESVEGAQVYQIAAALDYLSNKSTFDLMVSTFEFIESETSEVRELIDKFEVAYKAKDAQSLLFTYMTEPVTQEEKDLRSILYQGRDTKGNLGGPVLFESASASSYVVHYKILEIKKLDGSYQVRIKESYNYWNPVSGRTETGERISIAIVVEVNNQWLIDKYMTEGYPDGKYSGFGG